MIVRCQPPGKEENYFIFLSEGRRDKEKGKAIWFENGSFVAEERHGAQGSTAVQSTLDTVDGLVRGPLELL